jgi:methyl-accepting chemotaxis protein
MNLSLKKMFGIHLSLRKQVLLFVTMSMVFGLLLFSAIMFAGVTARGGDSRAGEITSLLAKTSLISLLFIAGFYFVFAYFLDRYMNRPIARITAAMRDNAGDLTVRVPVTTDNEIGELANWFNEHLVKLQEIIMEVSDVTGGISYYAGSISAAIEQQAATTSQQSAAVAEITSTMEELSASSTQIAEHSQSVVTVATKTWEDTKKGANAVEALIMKMGEIHGDNQNNIREIVELGKKSKEISKVMEIINNIADQTKLIAFNAALEASSAGEAGKRFGVVAVEIRRLADSVMESTGEIETKVSEIQEAINRLVIASEKGAKGIQEGMDYSSQTAETLFDVVDAAQLSTDAAKQISLSTQQQKTASNQVVGALREIVAGSGQTSGAIGQIVSITKKMSEMSGNLKALVEKFKV